MWPLMNIWLNITVEAITSSKYLQSLYQLGIRYCYDGTYLAMVSQSEDLPIVVWFLNQRLVGTTLNDSRFDCLSVGGVCKYCITREAIYVLCSRYYSVNLNKLTTEDPASEVI